MRKKRTLLICASCALLAILALLAYTSFTSEPSYDGHPLSYWVVLLNSSFRPDFPNADYEKATNAIGHIGLAAIPFFVKWIQYEPPQWRATVGNWLRRRPFPFATPMSDWIMEPRAQQLGVPTAYAFRVLGETATPASGDLCRLMNDTNRPEPAARAAIALSCLGTNAFVLLLTVATNVHHPAHLAAIDSISLIPDLGDLAQLLVPAITNCLNAANDPYGETAIFSLANLNPRISVPVLVSCLQSSNPTLRILSATTLGQLGPSVSNAIPALTNALADPDPRVHESASDALHHIDPATFKRAPLRPFPFH